jgi:hypothetical protein
MKRMILTLLLAGSVSGLALAQPAPANPPPSPTPDQTAPPGGYPQSTTPQSSDSGTATGTTDKHALMKQCVAQQKQQASNSGMSGKDIKAYCKKQVTAATQPQDQAPH